MVAARLLQLANSLCQFRLSLQVIAVVLLVPGRNAVERGSELLALGRSLDGHLVPECPDQRAQRGGQHALLGVGDRGVNRLGEHHQRGAAEHRTEYQ